VAGERTPGPVCQVERPVFVQDGTMCVAPTPAPGPVGSEPRRWTPPEPGALSGAQVTQSVSISIGAETTWEAAVREVYNQSAEAIKAQGQEFVRSGVMTAEEAKVWVNGQRNALVMATRDKSSPIGRAIAELIKPQSKLKTVSDLEKLGKTAEGIIESSGKTNPWVNRVTTGFRYGGPALLVVGLSFSAYHIATAPANERWHMAAREAGSWTGALAGGWAGGVAGCELFGAIGSVFPGPGTAVGCGVGVLVGTVGGAVFFSRVGSDAGDFVYRSLNSTQSSAATAGDGK
jgi:hypothetical protein